MNNSIMNTPHPSFHRLQEAARLLSPPITGPSELARALDELPQTLTNWASRKTGVSHAGATNAQTRLGISASYIRDGVAPMFIGEGMASSSAPEQEPRRVKVKAFQIRAVDGDDGADPATDAMIPVYDIEVSAGSGSIIPDFVETKYRLPYQIDWLNKWDAKPEDILIAKVNGASMEPIIWHGDKAVIHRKRRTVGNGKVYSLIYGGEARIKRLYRQADGSLRINSANADKDQYPDEIIDSNDMDGIYIIGQVIDKMGSGGLGI